LLGTTTEYNSSFVISGPFVNGSLPSVYCAFHPAAWEFQIDGDARAHSSKPGCLSASCNDMEDAPCDRVSSDDYTADRFRDPRE
jgi:hypothetical protein